MRQRIFGARFDFVFGCPTYAGDLQVLFGVAAATPRRILRRKENGELVVGTRSL